jgi:hypothetical protein
MDKNNPHLAPRTIREWLELIPFDRARKEAIENYSSYKNKSCADSIYLNSLCEAVIMCAFIYNNNKWMILFESLKRMESSVKLKQKDHGASFGMGY